ncbi:MAG: hypothetical protein MUE42_12405, partial [Opitutaceae bacterium]|nr:hypothetical protein [Opitutaceae bacterium]
MADGADDELLGGGVVGVELEERVEGEEVGVVAVRLVHGLVFGDAQAVFVDRVGGHLVEGLAPFGGGGIGGAAGAGVGLEEGVEQPADEGDVVVGVGIRLKPVVFGRAHGGDLDLALLVADEFGFVGFEDGLGLGFPALDHAGPVAGEAKLPPVVVEGPG